MSRRRALSNACFAVALTSALVATVATVLFGSAYGAPGFWTACAFGLVAWLAERGRRDGAPVAPPHN
ncbi:hypothetical protein [Kitasatospora sp. NPDC057015]|uniref:hypothetical protein n=1 Tax=Kitasatospora sp. NPDC057015 TaxID=3346001 RepID=UPI00362897DF